MNKTKQRFISLEVDEVSVVDKPANESQFVVVKSLDQREVNQMANEKKNEVAAPQGEVQQVTIETEKSDSEAVEKAFAQVTKMVSDIAAAVGAKKDETAIVEKAEKDEPKAEVVAKSDAEKEEELISKALEGVVASIQKAKQFTPARQDALKAALETLMGLAKELGMQEIPVGASPATNTPKGTTFGASGTQELTKALEGLKASIDSIKETTKSLNDRVEAVEKVRNPSNALSNDETHTKTEKSNKNLWSGVL